MSGPAHRMLSAKSRSHVRHQFAASSSSTATRLATGTVHCGALHDTTAAAGSTSRPRLHRHRSGSTPGRQVRGVGGIVGGVCSNPPTVGESFLTLWGTAWEAPNRNSDKLIYTLSFTAAVVLTLPERPQRRVRSSGLLPQAARSGCVAPVRRKQVPAVLPRRLPDLCGQLAARRDHERARVAGRLTVGQALQDRLEEGRGLARAAHGANELSARAEFHKNYASFRSCPLSSRADRRLYQPTRAAENPGVREAGVGAGQHPLL